MDRLTARMMAAFLTVFLIAGSAVSQYLATVEFTDADVKANTTKSFGAAFPAGDYEVVYLNGAMSYNGGNPARRYTIFDEVRKAGDNWTINFVGGTAVAPGDDVGYGTADAVVVNNFNKRNRFTAPAGAISIEYFDTHYGDNTDTPNYFLWGLRLAEPEWTGELNLVVGDIDINDTGQMDGNEQQENNKAIGGTPVLLRQRTPIWALVPEGLNQTQGRPNQGKAVLTLDLPFGARLFDDDGVLVNEREIEWDADEGARRYWLESYEELEDPNATARLFLKDLDDEDKDNLIDDKFEDKVYFSSYCPCGTEGGSSSGGTGGSLVLQIDLGKTRYGESAGYFRLVAEKFDTNTSVARSLQKMIHEDLIGVIDASTGFGLITGKPGSSDSWGVVEIGSSQTQGPTGRYGIYFYNSASDWSDDIANGTRANAFRIIDVTEPAADQLKVVETQRQNGETKRYWHYTYSSGTNQNIWELEEGSIDNLGNETILKKEKTVDGRVVDNGQKTGNFVKTTTIRNPDNSLVSEVTEQWERYSWGNELLTRTVGSGDNALKEEWKFDDIGIPGEQSASESYGRKTRYFSATGYWEIYQYSFNQDAKRSFLRWTIKQLDDNSYPPAKIDESNDTDVVCEEYWLEPQFALSINGKQYTYRAREVKVAGKLASKSFTIHTAQAQAQADGIQEQYEVKGVIADPIEAMPPLNRTLNQYITAVINGTAPESLVTKTSSWSIESEESFVRLIGDDSQLGTPFRIDHPDGQITLIDRQLDSNPARDYIVTTLSGYIDDTAVPDPVVQYGTKTIEKINVRGSTIETFTQRAAQQTNNGNLFTVSLVKAESVDVVGRPTEIDYFFGDAAHDEWTAPGSHDSPTYTVTQTHACCGAGTERNFTGRTDITSKETSDALGRLIEMAPAFGALGGDIRTKLIYDAADRVIARRIVPDSGVNEFEYKVKYDTAGRVTMTEDAEGRRKFYVYQRVNSNGDGLLYSSANPQNDAGKFYWETRVYGHDRATGEKTIPVVVTWTDSHGRIVRSWTGSTDQTWNESSPPAASGTLTEQSRTTMRYPWVDWTEGSNTQTRSQVEQLVYHDLPASLATEGSPGTNYRVISRTLSDAAGRPIRRWDGASNVTETVYEDKTGRVIETWFGVPDPATVRHLIKNDLHMISKMDYRQYSGGSLFTPARDRPFPGRTYTVKPGLAVSPNHNDLANHYVYLDREEVFNLTAKKTVQTSEIWSKPQHRPWLETTSDSEGRIVSEIVYENGVTANELSGKFYTYHTQNSLGGGQREGRLQHIDVKPNDGDVTDAHHNQLTNKVIRESFYYDGADRLVKHETHGSGYIKIEHDPHGRVLRVVHAADEGTTNIPYSQLPFVFYATDDILTEKVYEYDDTGLLLKTTHYDRRDDKTTSTNGLLSAGGTSIARITYEANWYDDNARLIRSADFGVNNYTDLVYATTPMPDPSESTTVWVKQIDYNLAGRAHLITTNGRNASDSQQATKRFFDDADRVTFSVENYKPSGTYWNGALDGDDHPLLPNSPRARESYENRITQYVYDDDAEAGGYRTQLIAIDPNDDGDTNDNQITRYIHSGELNLAKRGPIPVNGRKVATLMPEAHDFAGTPAPIADTDVIADLNGSGHAGEYTLHTYTADGRIATITDRRGVEWTYEYTPEGWLDHRRITALGQWTVPSSAVGGVDQRVEYDYGPAGELIKITCSTDAAGNNDISTIVYEHDGFFNVDKEVHDYDSIGGGFFSEQTITRKFEDKDDVNGVSDDIYDHAFRLDWITYPNGRKIQIKYGSQGSANYDAIGRPSGLTDLTDNYAITAYDRMGSGRIARKSYPVPGVRMDDRDEGSEGDSMSDPYDASWDTLGRRTRCQWETYNTGTGAGTGDLFHITHAYDGSSNRIYDHRKVYRLHSTAYTHDELDRVDGVGTGLLDTDVNGNVQLTGGLATLDSKWTVDDRDWSLDQLNNPERVDTAFDSTDKYGVETNEANEIKQKTTDPVNTPDEVLLTFDAATDFDVFVDQVTVDTGSEVDISTYITGPTNDDMVIDSGGAVVGEDSPAVLLVEPEMGNQPYAVNFMVGSLPASTERGLVGYVFGYKSPTDFWVWGKNMTPGGVQADGDLQLFHMNDANDNGSIDFSDSNERKLVGSFDASAATASTIYEIFSRTARNSAMQAYSAASLSGEGGFPAGRVGIYTEVPDTRIDTFRLAPLGPSYSLGSVWESDGPNRVLDGGSGNGRLETTGNYAKQAQPVLHKHLRASRFQADFALTRASGSSAGVFLVFGYNSRGDKNQIYLEHNATATASSVRGFVYSDGDTRSEVGTKNVTYMESQATAATPIWYRVVSDGVDVKVFSASTPGELNARQASDHYCYFADGLFPNLEGRIGFAAGSSTAYIDDITIKSDPDNDASLTSAATYETIEVVESFTLNTSDEVEDAFEYDEAGNITFDGHRIFEYDGRNRLVRVYIGFKDIEHTPSGGNAGDLAVGSILADMRYDGRNRRIIEATYTADGFDHAALHYYDGNSLIETQNWVEQVVTQYVWHSLAPGTDYIDCLAEVNHNLNPGFDESPDPGVQDYCESRLFALQADAGGQKNLIGLVTASGELIYRKEYTLYGQPTVYTGPWASTEALLNADVNGDGKVDGSDLGDILSNWGPTTSGNRRAGDVNGDGMIDGDDFNYVSEYYNLSETAPVHPAGSSITLNLTGQPLCAIGFQGLRFVPATNTTYNRMREYLQDEERFAQKDPHPSDYPDGMNSYAAYHVMLMKLDPWGMNWLTDLALGAVAKTAEVKRKVTDVSTRAGIVAAPLVGEALEHGVTILDPRSDPDSVEIGAVMGVVDQAGDLAVLAVDEHGQRAAAASVFDTVDYIASGDPRGDIVYTLPEACPTSGWNNLKQQRNEWLFAHGVDRASYEAGYFYGPIAFDAMLTVMPGGGAVGAAAKTRYLIPDVPDAPTPKRVLSPADFADRPGVAGGGASLNNITQGQAIRIQNACDRLGVPITLVGSRAAGTSNPLSDWDFLIPGNHKVRHSAASSLPEGERVGIGSPRNQDIFNSDTIDTDKPYIRFEPEAEQD